MFARRTIGRISLGIAALAAPAAGEPMDLANAQPRLVAVRFEVSPADRPGQIDAVYTPEFAAWLEPGEQPGEVRVRIDGWVVEEHLLEGHQPQRGTFSDFVWVFDAATGAVRSATVTGWVERELRFGFVSWRAEARVIARMDTQGAAGYGAAGELFGHAIRRFCRSAQERSDCTLVPARPYDRLSGYVNAVGEIRATTGSLEVDSFSPLGEAIFSEVDPAQEAAWRIAGPGDALSAHVSSPPPASQTP